MAVDNARADTATLTIAWRMLVIGLSGGLAWFAFANAAAHITRESNPAAALRFSAHDPNALSASGDILIAKLKQKASVPFATGALAQASLAGQAINPRALRQLGFVADAKGQAGQALKLISLSARTSRREFGAQLWLIENGVRANNIAATLAHYDAALRSNDESGPILFPILTRALDDATLQSAFVGYIKSPPPWLTAFVGTAIWQGDNPAAIAATIKQAGGLPHEDGFIRLETQLLGQLAAKGAFVEARQFYASLKGATPNLPTTTVFTTATIDPKYVPMAWQLQSTAGIEASFEPTGNDASQQLHVFANSGERGIVLHKLLYLAPGTYAFAQAQTRVRFANGAASYWELKCIRGIDAVSIWRSDGGGADSQYAITISPNCSTQSIILYVAGGANQDGAELIVKSIALTKTDR